MISPERISEREQWNEALSRSVTVGDKNWWIAVACSLFGVFGLDRFYVGRPLLGLAKLLTTGGLLVWWIVDLVLLLSGRMKDGDGKYIRK